MIGGCCWGVVLIAGGVEVRLEGIGIYSSCLIY